MITPLPHAFLPQALTKIHARGVTLVEVRYDSMFITDDAEVSCSLATSDDYTRTSGSNGAQGNNRKAFVNCQENEDGEDGEKTQEQGSKP